MLAGETYSLSADTGVTTYALHPGYIFSSLLEGIRDESKITYYIFLAFKW